MYNVLLHKGVLAGVSNRDEDENTFYRGVCQSIADCLEVVKKISRLLLFFISKLFVVQTLDANWIAGSRKSKTLHQFDQEFRMFVPVRFMKINEKRIVCWNASEQSFQLFNRWTQLLEKANNNQIFIIPKMYLFVLCLMFKDD